jgi:uncharacterized protein YlxW (UPF0749 family)
MRPTALALVALVALGTGFVVADQVRAQLLTPSDQLARHQALVASVQELEKANAATRRDIAGLRSEIESLEADAAARSEHTKALRDEVAGLRAHVGLSAVHGPGVEVELRNGIAGAGPGAQTGYLVNFQDVQDVVGLLFASGAEAVAVSGRRITPLSAFSGAEGEVVVDQGPPLSSPITIAAVGDRNRMVAALDDEAALPGVHAREVQFALRLTFAGSPDVSLPAYDSSLQVAHAVAG